jgi:hypothetical protein
MARTGWFDDKAGHEAIQDRVRHLDSFTSALADGVITSKELDVQEKRLIEAMKAAEPSLSDEQHAKLTTVLVEMTAYNIMRLLHELQAERTRMAIG